jgi:NTE family protein
LYASRTRHDIRDYRRLQDIRRAFQALREKLPSELHELPEVERIARLLTAARFTIIRLICPDPGWGMPTKDIDFSRSSIKWRWEQGYKDAMRALAQEEWLRLPSSTGVVVYELGPEQEEKAVSLPEQDTR